MVQTQNQLSPHEVLGVAVTASMLEIRAAYLREARRWHPDKRRCDETLEAKEAAHRQFIAVHTAWEKLQQGCAVELEAAPAKASFANRFKGSAEKLVQYRSEREAAEEALENLRSAALAGEWLENDCEVLRQMAAKAQRTIEALRKLELFYEARADVAKEWAASLENSPANTSSTPSPVSQEKTYRLASMKELLNTSKERGIDVTGCIEKSDIIECHKKGKSSPRVVQRDFWTIVVDVTYDLFTGWDFQWNK